MERRLHHLALLLGLLAWAAAAATGAEAQLTCINSAAAATQIARFCKSLKPTAPCCEPIFEVYDLRGGIACICRVSANPQVVRAGLNATHLLALYTSCGGHHPVATADACRGTCL